MRRAPEAPGPGASAGGTLPVLGLVVAQHHEAGEARDVEDLADQGRRRPDRQRAARDFQAIGPLGDHGQTRRIHEAQPHQIQHDRAVAPIDHRLEEGPELRRREHVHLAPQGQDHLPIHKTGANREVGQGTISARHF